VAVKVLGEHLANRPAFIERFYREARLSCTFDHPNLIRGLAHGFDTNEQRHFLILEHVDGPNALALLNQNGSLPIPLVAKIGLEIARALQFLHAREYVHRDVKPENLLVAPDGTAKLGDLGLAKRLDASAELSASDEGVGTPHYMPYEQAVNGVLVDARSDLFALGATLYHLLTGQVPFPGHSHEEIVREKARGAFRPARVVRPDVPVELDRILSYMLARDPRDRVQSAGELLNTLGRAGLDRLPFELADFGITDSLDGTLQAAARTHADLAYVRAEDAVPAVAPSHKPAAGPRLLSFLDSRRRWAMLLAILIAGFAGLGGTWAVFQSRFARGEPTHRPTAADETGLTAPSVSPDVEYNKPAGASSGG
jgi:serine/threonine-protein kinase